MKNYIFQVVSEDTTKVNPEYLRDIVGQDEVREKLSFFVESHCPDTPFPTMLFTGSQGLGKSFMAEKVSKALGRRFVEINCKTLRSVKDFVEKLLFQEAGRESLTILIDEAHELSADITTILLSFLNPNVENVNYVSYNGWSIEYDFSKINIIFATTDVHQMFRPLVNRCTEIYFHPYTQEDLFKILALYLPNIKLKADKNEIADACRRRARDAFKLSQIIKRQCAKEKTKILTPDGWDKVKRIFGIHNRGLYTQEIVLLQTLAQHSPISGNNLAIKLGLNQKNVEQELEVWPRELGFVESGPRGHYITEEGEAYLERV